MNQNATNSKPLFTRGNQVVWVAEIAGSPAKYLAVFNTGDSGIETIHVKLSDLGLTDGCIIRDLWQKRDIGNVSGGRDFAIAPHASAFYKFTPAAANGH